MKKGLWILTLMLLIAWGGCCTAAWAEIIDRIVATVNGEIITLKDINDRLAPVLKARGIKDREEANKLRRSILEHLINRILIQQEAERLKIKISESHVDKAIERIKSHKNLTQEQLIAELAGRGLTIKILRGDITDDLYKNRVIQQEILSRVVVSDRDIDNYYQSHQEEFDVKPKVHLRNILIAVPKGASSSVIREKEKQAENVRAEIQGGLEFTQAATTHSQAPNAKDGGDLGMINKEDLSDDIKKVIIELKKGQISRPVRTDPGFQIFQLVDEVDADQKVVAKIKKDIRDRLARRQASGKIETWLRELRENALIKIKF